MAEEVADHVDNQDSTSGEVQDGGQDGVPEALGVDLTWSDEGFVDTEGCGYGDELGLVSGCPR